MSDRKKKYYSCNCIFSWCKWMDFGDSKFAFDHLPLRLGCCSHCDLVLLWPWHLGSGPEMSTALADEQHTVAYRKWVCLKMLCTPLYPMVLLIIIPIKWLFHWEYTQHFQTNPNTLLKGMEVGKTPAKVDENIMQKFFKKEEAQKLRICLVDCFGSSEDRARQKALGLIIIFHIVKLPQIGGTMLHFRTHPFPFMHSLIQPSIFDSGISSHFVCSTNWKSQIFSAWFEQNF